MEVAPEVEARLKRNYIDRLAVRVRKVRKLLVERDWEALRTECHQIALTSQSFRLDDVAGLALLAEESIPTGRVPRASVLPHARQAIEALITAMDHCITETALKQA